MRKPHLIFLITILTALTCSLVFPNLVSAQAVVGLNFVYGTNHYNGATFSSTFVPSSVKTMYLLADHHSIIAARMTQIYYWPVTNEYKADWDSYNLVVDGTLEIYQGKELYQSLKLTDYVIQYDGNNKIDTTRLYVGEEAVAARQNYEELQAKYRDDLHAYYKLLNAFTASYQAALGAVQRGELTEDQLPEAPPPLADLTLFSTEVLKGFPVNLPVGEYDIQLRLPDDTIQYGSEKHLVVFTELQEGIGYSVAGESRWNLPEQTLADTEVIYGIKGETYYIQPVYQKKYNELNYTRMNNPQDKSAREDRTIWIPFHSAEDVTLRVVGKNDVQNIALVDFLVQQILGSKLGYDIVPFDAATMTKPTFTAFKLPLENSSIYKLQLVSSEGKILEGSSREVRVVNSGRAWLVYVVSAIPLLAGLLILIMRRKIVRNIKVVGVG